MVKGAGMALSVRSSGERKLGVIDIGSNSVRLVVFAGPLRSPTSLFNEKSMCGLGRGLVETGRLNEEGVIQAKAALARFAAVAKLMGVNDLDVVATAAVRDAENGRAFVADVERDCGFKIRILSGEQEAELSALGVLSGEPHADGLIGDIGGGSLELIEMNRGRPGGKVTLPLGPFRLQPLVRYEAIRARVNEQLAAVPWLERGRGRSLIVVGGAWRAIARIHMVHSGYPLKVIHLYRVPYAEAVDFTRVLARASREQLARMAGVPRRRADILPLTALVLRRLLKSVEPRDMVFSAYGLREGMQFARLSAEERSEDPLMAFCRDVAGREGRFPEHGAEIERFVAPLFISENAPERRLRIAAAYLSDVAWRAHPDHRGEQAFLRILHAGFAGVTHDERVFLAYAVFARYAGFTDDPLLAEFRRLLTPDAEMRALMIGLALRLAQTLSAGTPGVLAQLKLVPANGRLTLVLPVEWRALNGETIQRRLDVLARAFGLQPVMG